MRETTTSQQQGSAARAPQTDRVPLEQPLSVLDPQELASIIIPCCGQLEYTRLCVPSVLKHTRWHYEMIFLNVGSLDGTAEYLAGIVDATAIRAEVVHAPTDLDIADAVQEAIKLARGEYLVLLNNDTVVTDAWLNQLVGLAKMSPAIGMV